MLPVLCRHRVAILVALGGSLAACPAGPFQPADSRPDREEWLFPDGGPLPPDLAAPGNDRCAGATLLALAGGKATIDGTTAGATNEYGAAIRCGEMTPLLGPQRYYRIAMARDRVYRLELDAAFGASLYLATDCSANIINADCGASGALAGPTAPGAPGRLHFQPPASGSYLVVVDSAGDDQRGTFTLAVEELVRPPNASCAAAQPLTLDGGSVTVPGNTLGAPDEAGALIHCRLGRDFDGPQLYYTVDLQGGAWYRLALAADFPAALYLANAAAKCKPENIDVDCGGMTGTVLPLVPRGGSAATAFSPPVSGEHLVVVDSADPQAAGSFTLTIETLLPAVGMTCSGATPLLLQDGKVSAVGDTSGHLNDLGAHVACGAAAPLLAPQAYFSLTLEAQPYLLGLQSSFAATLAVGASCLTLPVDCGGLGGGALAVAPGSSGTLRFLPPAPGTYVLVVDGTAPDAAGSFALEVQEESPPLNGTCLTPATLPLPASPSSALGSTGPLPNDLAGVDCALPQGPFAGPQAYYRLSLAGGQTYRLDLVPEATFDPALYAFPAATPCTTAAVNVACAGAASDVIGGGLSETLFLSPAADADYLVVVDSWSASEVGSFALTVSW